MMAAKVYTAARSSDHLYERKEYYGSGDRDSAPNYNLMLGTAGSPVRINPWNFIGSFNPKKQALAIARDIDLQRGIQLDSSTSQEGAGSDNGEESTTSTVRRLPSGAKPPSSAHSIQATTPVKPNSAGASSSNEESINNVAGQSTPLTQGKVVLAADKQNDPSIKLNTIKEGPPINRIEKTEIEDNSSLRDEIDRLKEVNETQKIAQAKTRIEIQRIKGSLDDKTAEINSLQEIITSKENALITRDDQLAEVKKLLEVKDEHKAEEVRNLKKILREIESECLVDREGDDSRGTSEKLQSSLSSMLLDLKSRILKQELERKEAFKTEKKNWSTKIDELNQKTALEKDEAERVHAEEKSQLNELVKEISEKQKSAQDANEKANRIYSPMEKELKSLKLKMEKQLTENISLQSRISDSSKLINELKGDIASAASTTEEAVRNYEKLSKALEDEKRNHVIAKQRLKDIIASSEKFKKFVQLISLFEKDLGEIVINCFGRNSTDPNFESYFRSIHDNIIGFNTKELEDKRVNLLHDLEMAKEQNRNLVNEIENKWKPDLKKQTQGLEELKIELEVVKEHNTCFTDQKFELEKKLKAIQEDKESLLLQRDTMLATNTSLFREVESLKRGKLDEYQGKLSQLFEKFEEFTGIISRVQQQISMESERQKLLSNSITAKDSELKQLQEDLQQTEVSLQEKTSQLKKIQGDISKRITFQLACRSRPDIDRENYANLMIDKVDTIDMVELQNIVKNLILLLEIPFNKLTKKSPLVAIYLKYERPIFSHFANRLHYEIFNEPIEMKSFTNEAYDQYTESHKMSTITHPLESCLENLYQKLVSKI